MCTNNEKSSLYARGVSEKENFEIYQKISLQATGKMIGSGSWKKLKKKSFMVPQMALKSKAFSIGQGCSRRYPYLMDFSSLYFENHSEQKHKKLFSLPLGWKGG
jgi:hypothetical protein